MRPLRFLVAECEPPQAREKRRASVGRSSGETYQKVLLELAPAAVCDRVVVADKGAEPPAREALSNYDAVFLTGSPLHLYDQRPEVEREVAFMQQVFASGTPSFGSCAGLQLATVAAGGTVRPNASGTEAGFARRITPTAEGRSHPLLNGRPATYDAPAIHTDEVERLPDGGTLLATNAATRVQAAEIRCGPGVFWGVQYHPEISLAEVAAALQRQLEDLMEHQLVRCREDLDAHADLLRALHDEPGRRDIAWRLGLDAEVTDTQRRRTEIRNFIDVLVGP